MRKVTTELVTNRAGAWEIVRTEEDADGKRWESRKLLPIHASVGQEILLKYVAKALNDCATDLVTARKIVPKKGVVSSKQ